MNRAQDEIGPRRKEVDKLLRNALDRKRLRGETEGSRRLLRQAYDLARRPSPLPEPWPALTAYRLAHVLMRSPGKEELAEVHDLLEEAIVSKALGPKPAIYMLAVLNRLGEISRLKPAFQQAVEQVRHWPSLGKESEGSEENGVQRRRLAPLVRPVQADDTHDLQNNLFNLLEMASYFLGLPYDPLEGMGMDPDPYQDLFPSWHTSPWILVGHDPSLSAFRYPEELAVTELENIAGNDPGALLFKLSVDEHVWRKPGDSWVNVGPERLRLLALLLRQPTMSQNQLRRSLADGGEFSDSHFRQTKRRLKQDLATICSIGENDVFEELPGQFLKLSPEIQVFGAVQVDSLGWW